MQSDVKNFDEPILKELKIFKDLRGKFSELYRESDFLNSVQWRQDNISISKRGSLRGLHFQSPQRQAKLITLIEGEVLDVLVDLRRSLKTYKKISYFNLSSSKHHQLYIPPHFAHGFLTLSESATVFYKVSEYYSPESEYSILWSDPDLSIDWPKRNMILSDKDRKAPSFKEIEKQGHF